MEIEHRYRDYDKRQISLALKNLKKHPPILLRNTIYHHPQQDYYIRVRETPSEAYLTLKTPHSEFWEEIETTVGTSAAAHAMLLKLGCTRTYVVEKLRETWDVAGGIEFAFDQYPGLPEFLEIETKTKKDLRTMEKRLGLVPENFGVRSLYASTYGASDFKGDIEFRTAARVIGPAIRQNKKEFTKLLRAQKQHV